MEFNISVMLFLDFQQYKNHQSNIGKQNILSINKPQIKTILFWPNTNLYKALTYTVFF